MTRVTVGERFPYLNSQATVRSKSPGQTRAQHVTSELSHTQGELRRVEDLRRRLDDLPVMYELAEEEQGSDGADALAEADAELKSLREEASA